MKAVAVESQINAVRVLASVAGTNTITGSMTPDLTAYSTGMMVIFVPANANTGAATLNIDSLGAKSIKKWNGIALTANDLLTTAIAFCVYDGTNFVLQNPQNSQILFGTVTIDLGSIASGARSTTSVTVTGASAGDPVAVGSSTSPAGLQKYAEVTSANTVAVGFFNYSAGAVDPASTTFIVSVFKS